MKDCICSLSGTSICGIKWKKKMRNFNFKTSPGKDLEQDLIDCQFIKDKIRSENGYATRLYGALCNINWYHDSQLHGNGNEDDAWHCSWRYAGDLVATLRGGGANYLDYYSSGNEGLISTDIADDLNKIGWRGIAYKG